MKTAPNQKIWCYFKANLLKGGIFYERKQTQGGTEQMRELNVYGICEADVHLAAGLPLTWIRKQREDFRSYLLRNKEVNFRFNSKGYHIRFVGCSLFPQGYPAIVSRLGDFNGTNLLADIGNGTMNILYINNKKAVESRCWTEKFGVNQCMIAAKNAVLDSFGVKIE